MLRNSLALSTILNKELHYSQIRANRGNSGINRQLQTGVIEFIYFGFDLSKLDQFSTTGL